MGAWTSGIIFGFIAGGCLAYFVGCSVGYSNGIKKGKKIACQWLMINAKACEYAAKRGFYAEDNRTEANKLRDYVEHIEEYNGNG